jgi:hypothetical protein
MDKPGVNLVRIHIINTLDAQRKNPRVNKLIGRSNKFRIGLTRIFKTVNVAPAVRKEFNPPLILNAGTITVRTYNATALIRKDFNIFFTDIDFIRSEPGVQTVISRLL